MDPSLKPDPNLKGSYHRRIDDIERAFRKMDADNLPTAAKFLVRYFGCEKFAQIIVGVANDWPPKKVLGPGKFPDPEEVKRAVRRLQLTFPVPDQLDHLFAKWNEPTIKKPLQEPISARDLRDAVVHNFGPTNIGYVLKKAGILLPMMDSFLSCRGEVTAYLEKQWLTQSGR
jgi:hypothetical protein